MKKIFTLGLMLTLFGIVGAGFSQTKFPMKLGLKVAPNIGWMSPGTKGYSSDGARLGGTIGFVSDFYFAENYAFSTGFNFQFINGKLNYTDLLQVDTTMVNEDVFRKYSFLYLEIPLMIKMKTKKFGNIAYFGQIGIGTAFRLKATIKDNLVPATSEMGTPENFNDGTTLIRESIIIGIGCEYHIDESSRILIGISYSNALNNILTGVNRKSNLNEKSQLNFAEINIGFLF
ncbi:MAG: porin family protein [Bacteroidales bacterium]|nr:porin family protein [Bacteroidales bacterium]